MYCASVGELEDNKGHSVDLTRTSSSCSYSLQEACAADVFFQ